MTSVEVTTHFMTVHLLSVTLMERNLVAVRTVHVVLRQIIAPVMDVLTTDTRSGGKKVKKSLYKLRWIHIISKSYPSSQWSKQ